MKVKMVCTRDHETKEIDIPMDEGELLKLQGKVMDRDTIGYIASVDVNYYDENGNEIENIFLLNRKLKNAE